jgi:hypothetical protein
MRTGDIVLFESPNDGMFEVRLLTHNYTGAEFLISQISPRPGLVGGFVSDDPNNSPFSSDELARIAESVTQIRFKLDQLDTFLPEQIALVNRKLDEIEAAATRLGRKDWINYVVGVLTSISVSAAFTPEASKALFSSVGTAFEWLLNNAIIMLQ